MIKLIKYLCLLIGGLLMGSVFISIYYENMFAVGYGYSFTLFLAVFCVIILISYGLVEDNN